MGRRRAPVHSFGFAILPRKGAADRFVGVQIMPRTVRVIQAILGLGCPGWQASLMIWSRQSGLSRRNARAFEAAAAVEVAAYLRQQPRERGEHRTVSPVRPWTGDLTAQDRDLMLEHQDLRILDGIAAR